MRFFHTDVLCIGAGLAGERVAIEAAKAGFNVICLSIVPPRRSHSCCAQGGMQAALGNSIMGDGDCPEIHFNDTVKGSDWGCDQEVARIFAKTAPIAMREMAFLGCPWNRVVPGEHTYFKGGKPFQATEKAENEGLIHSRAFGGTAKWRTCYTSDGTGHEVLYTLDNRAIQLGVTVHDRMQAEALIHDGDQCMGCVARDLRTGELVGYFAKATLIATGGYGRIYRATTNSVICDGGGHIIALDTGIVPLGNMEAVQFHPTGTVPTDILVTEGCRGDGGTLLDKNEYRFMPDYEPEKAELASRDVVSRRMTEHMRKGFGHIGMGVEYQDGDKPSGDYEVSRLMGVVGNFNYGYDNRYLVDFSVRSDGSSVYGSSKRWGTFGSVGVAWNLHHEKWLAENPYVNELKIRGSWGTTGGQNFYPFQAMMMYSYKESAIDGLTYDDYIGALLKAFGNPDLKWQQTEKLNVGVDFTLLNSRLSGYFNIYKDVSKSVLIDVLLAPSVGFASYKDNLGEIENKGLELNLRGVLLKDADRRMQWDVFFNIVKNKNRLMKLNDALAAYNKSQDDEMNGEIEEGKTRAPMVRYQEGKSINMIWANESIGIDPNTGEEVFIALNGDKVNKWSTDNYKPLGCSDPKFEGNFGTMFMYKGFQLNAYFRYSYGADVYNQTLVDKVENVDPKENADRRVLYDRWKTPGDVAKFKAISNTEATMPTSRFIEQENYITLSSLNLSYQFDAGRLRHYGIERLKLSLIGNDVFRASTVKMERGTSYPFARNYSVALQVTF